VSAGWRAVEKAVEAIGTGRIAPLYVVCGEEEYLIFDAVRRLLAALGAGEGSRLSLVRLDAGESTPEALRQALLTRSLFVSRTVVHLGGLAGRETGNRARMIELVLDWAKGQPPDAARGNVLIVEYRGKLRGNHRLARLASRLETLFSFQSVAGYNLGNPAKDEAIGWCEARLREVGKRLSREAFSELRRRLGPDFWMLHNELEKLVAYVGERTEITLEDVRTLTPEVSGERVFQLLDLVAEGNAQALLELFGRIIDEGTSPLMVVRFAHRRVRQLLLARELLSAPLFSSGGYRNYGYFRREVLPKLSSWVKEQGARGFEPLLSQHPYALFMLLQRAPRYSRGRLLRGLVRLADVEATLKSSQWAAGGRHELEKWFLDLLPGVALSGAGR
jgi:DNA polymerase-3 subunit delta